VHPLNGGFEGGFIAAAKNSVRRLAASLSPGDAISLG
jgi:hypothetical protein